MQGRGYVHCLALAVAAALPATSVLAQQAASDSEEPVEVISIFGQRNSLETSTGSAFVVDKEAMEQFEFDDIHRVLQSVPGVYVREEDGYGLRPNIGLRGATTERSSKVALMEDGVLIAPAPYAAPAAYFFPLTSRIEQVEVFKGPAAIKYGPNTIGGAINLVSRSIADVGDDRLGQLDLSAGENGYNKAHVFASQSIKDADYGEFGYLIEALTIGADGFKTLPNGGDTGFDKQEFLFKGRYIPVSERYQQWDVKFGYAEENSNETYLGLTDADFAIDSQQRYLGSQLDNMDWEHYQFQVSHLIELEDNLTLHTQAYNREFDRDWDRLSSFNTNRSLQTILSSPETGLNALYMQVLKGERDSLTAQEQLLLTLNDRRYYSRGIESKLFWDAQLRGADLSLDAGLRLHQDQVKRNHRTDYYVMQSQQMVLAGVTQQTTADNKDTVTAIAGFVNANLDFGDLTVSAGLRVENIDGEATDTLSGTTLDNSDTVVLPGVGAFYQLSDKLGLLAGVNKGFVPNSPGQADTIEPEESWNYEFGFRYSDSVLQAQMIGFYNDYSNLKGACTFSSGCLQQLDVEFNGGEVEVTGLESSVSAELSLNSSISMPVNFAYTYTKAEFQNDFHSNFVQWGNVTKGDKLPYLPEHQFSAEVALQHDSWRAALIFKYVDEMPESAGTAVELEGVMTEEVQQLDFSAWYQFMPELRGYLKIDNITDEQVIVSRRPFGARPGKPRQASVGIKYSF